MARFIKQPFFPAGDFVARKSFVFNGEQFNTGDDFPYEEMGVSERKMRTMYHANFLMRKPVTEEQKNKSETAKLDEKEKAELKRQRRLERRKASQAA